jgi:hypothetical protein
MLRINFCYLRAITSTETYRSLTCPQVLRQRSHENRQKKGKEPVINMIKLECGRQNANG